ncbi:MAG: 2-C-methyl-D-erythritol 4-phosphate cytidylyltransferase [Candidatus Omnitrophota bacterium]
MEGNGVVVIQNGDSPITPSDLINRCINAAIKKKAATAYIPAFFTTFETDKNFLKKVFDRKKTGYTCDPQAYEIKILKKALSFAMKNNIKDKPTVELVRAVGQSVFLVESDTANVKITTEQDLKRAEFVLKKRIQEKLAKNKAQAKRG